MVDSILRSKNVLAICMETTAGGRNYSGGLGALYGDITRTMYREDASFLAVTPIYKNGYVKQYVTDDGVIDEYPEQDFSEEYIDTGIILDIPILHRIIKVKVWKHKKIPICIGLDSFLPENNEFAYIMNNLYGENGIGQYDGEAQRLMQEAIAGAGCVLAARALGFRFNILHLNEGHGVFASLFLISELMQDLSYEELQIIQKFGYEHTDATPLSFEDAWKKVKKMTVFTTHTPISAGNKSRPIQTILDLGLNFGLNYEQLREIGGDSTGTMFGSTTAAIKVSKVVNAVALRHQMTSRELWKNVSGNCPITYVDNGVDINYWQSKLIRDSYQNGTHADLLAAHQVEKEQLIDYVKKENGVNLDSKKPIIGFARRVIAYKRADLIFEDMPRFEQLLEKYGLQIIFSGKTHPKDFESKQILMRLYQMSKHYPNNVIFLQNYDVHIAGLMTKGADIWLGNPEIPLEACSTSGMKAAANGVVNVSTADGWWYKSARYEVNGWIIGESSSHDKYTDAQYLYKVLDERVLPTYFNKLAWVEIMFNSITTALTECSSERMAREYYALYNKPYLE